MGPFFLFSEWVDIQRQILWSQPSADFFMFSCKLWPFIHLPVPQQYWPWIRLALTTAPSSPHILLTVARLFLQTDVYYCMHSALLLSTGAAFSMSSDRLRVLTKIRKRRKKNKSLCDLAADSSQSELLPLSSHSATQHPIILLSPIHSPIEVVAPSCFLLCDCCSVLQIPRSTKFELTMII